MYLVLLFNSKWKLGFKLYVGSSYGQLGLENRIYQNHAKEAYRKRSGGKYLYDLMGESGTTWRFIALAVFPTTAPKQLVQDMSIRHAPYKPSGGGEEGP